MGESATEEEKDKRQLRAGQFVLKERAEEGWGYFWRVAVGGEVTIAIWKKKV